MTRVLTALVLLPLFILLVVYGSDFQFFLLAEGIILLGLTEFLGFLDRGTRFLRVLGAGLGMATAYGLAVFPGPGFFYLCLIGILFLPFLWSFTQNLENPERVRISMTAVFGILYVSFPCALLILLRGTEGGGLYILWVCLPTFMGDTAAYWIGRRWGKTPFAPTISPKKTLEGTVGGAAGSVALSFFIGLGFIPTVDGWDCLIIGLITGVFGITGDLVESAIKRGFGVKDSGWIVPGHGGLLDRIDSLLMAGPVSYVYILFFVVPG